MLDTIKQEAQDQYNKVLLETNDMNLAAQSAIGIVNYHLQVLPGSDIRRKHLKDIASVYLKRTECED